MQSDGGFPPPVLRESKGFTVATPVEAEKFIKLERTMIMQKIIEENAGFGSACPFITISSMDVAQDIMTIEIHSPLKSEPVVYAKINVAELRRNIILKNYFVGIIGGKVRVRVHIPAKGTDNIRQKKINRIYDILKP